MSDFASQLNDLYADFQSLAHRARDTRAYVQLTAGRFGGYQFGPPRDDSGTASRVGSQRPVHAEFSSVTRRAGQLLLEMVQAGSVPGIPGGPVPVTWRSEDPPQFWLRFVVSSRSTAGYCWGLAADGTPWDFPVCHLHEGEGEVVIDDYAELCLAGLAKLKADLSVRQAGHRKKGAGGGEGQASRGDQGKPKRAKPRLEQSEKEADKLKCQLYQFIQNLHAAGKKPADILTELKGNPDRMAQVKGAGLNAKMNLIRAALALPGQRERDAKRKKQDSPPA